MKIKVVSFLMAVVMLAAVLVGCSSETKTGSDAVTTASIVDEEGAFKSAISADGKWIICTLNDLTFNEELVMEGEFHNKGDSEQKVYRKLAPYTQDDDHNIVDRFTLTIPKLTIKSPNTRFQGGTIKGDVVIDNNGFELRDATIDGNLYFTNEEYKNSAKLEEGTVTGSTEVQ